ncbi:MAG: GGDEF domain-containing protein [Clostridiaceae bacterium]|mgnify:FL=1|jgi:diguanylate cyclase (GGDEF)-like protein|nr:GGDEF domain-containing protein [Bacillota bacterium]NLI38656.1 GGDEF domain-containing protein [Clostridiaceae bacterium]
MEFSIERNDGCMRKIMTGLIPFAVILLAWMTASQAASFNDAVNSVLLVLPFVIAILAIFMSIWYKNSRFFFLTVFILLSYIILKIASSKEAMLIEAVTEISILIPINMIWLAFINERGIITSYGANKAILIGLQIVWVLINILSKSDDPTSGMLSPDHAMAIPAPAIILYILAIGLLLVNYILKGQYIYVVFISVLITTYISLHFAHRPVILAVFTSSVFIVVVSALFEVSYSLAFYDTLTGVLSRRAFEQELDRLGKQYCIAMVDIDHFKRVNDGYGHDVGDEVLKMVASILNKVSYRARTFRYGGEEFAIIFQGQRMSEVMTLLERVRKAVERRPFIIRSDSRPEKKPEKITGYSGGKGRINVTVSIGVAQKTESLKTALDVVKKADEALYRAKSGGRNRVSK